MEKLKRMARDFRKLRGGSTDEKKDEQHVDRDWDFDSSKYDKKVLGKLERHLYDGIEIIKIAFLTFVVDEGLPPQHRWIYQTLLLQYRQTLSNKIYPWTYLSALLAWIFPNINFHPYTLALIADSQIRSQYASLPNDAVFILRPIFFAGARIIIRMLFDFRDISVALETFLGSSDFWPTAVAPILPGLLLNAPRHTINGFVPEGKQGIITAIVLWACIAVLPKVFHYSFWLWFTGPDPFAQPVMAVEWLLCSIFWFSKGVPFQAAYVMHLFTNQYPHQEFWLRHNGGEASTILRMERRGCLWFAITSFFIKVLETDPTSAKTGSLTLPISTSLKIAVLIGIGLYLVRYGMAMRMTRFRHKPLRRPNEFRILRLRAQPCFRNSPVQCEIIHSTLDSPPPYRAVSHRWGSVGDEPQIILVDGAPFLVSTSVYDLLIELRETRFSHLLWIDSVCIDQSNAVEKSQQVGLMREIFEEATSTIGWLGKSPVAAKAFDLVRRIAIAEEMNQKELLSLKSSPSSGWQELLALMNNSWFNRVWIIQEIAASKDTKLRCGDAMIHWEVFAAGLGRILAQGLAGDEDLSIFVNEHLMNALIMENMHMQVDEVDRLALKDALKLGSRFKATLSVDNVFALLGITKERNAPLFHPNFRHSEVFTEEIFSRGGVAKDLFDTLDSFVEFSHGLRRTNPLQSRKTIRLLNSIPRATRSLTEMLDGMSSILDRSKKSKGSPYDIKPDYTDKSTPEVIYTMVARELVRTGDAFAFLRYAGIGNPRNPSFDNLPSWVPDWSADVNVYILPHVVKPPIKKPKSKSAGGAKSGENHRASVSDGGFNLLHVKGAVIGKVTYATTMRENLGKSRGNDLKDATADLELLLSNLDSALNAARGVTTSTNESDDDLDNLFLRTLLAKSSYEDQDNTSKEGVKWLAETIQKDRKLLEKLKESNLDGGPIPKTPFATKSSSVSLETMARDHLSKRKVESSSNSKFAHLMKMDVLPSFEHYRWRDKKIVELPTNPLRMFDKRRASVLAAYDQYVDYTLGRTFTVLDTGYMGLAPAGVEIGDFVIFVKEYGVFLAIRPAALSTSVKEELKLEELRKKQLMEERARKEQATKEKIGEGGVEQKEKSQAEPAYKEGQESHGPSDSDDGDSFDLENTFRLVGEAFVTCSNVQNQPGTETSAADDDLRWFSLW
ncbi:hypothetical protein CORC01_01077 [Colletotrichum orchidophilum]|uniref:Heterokaryon incompatibility domain-containing protein n=1 Tax=Colletotrichum orchidophilum TaxID=1209926 RepID=A0A1G4BR00_9PEZI|nr:uncharacterized protein CORC01_01077 [Colletotrichum orchidophilum]OHF03758.1 hypothetical protein CORC01_01077 [Colletotrichum orchidophilum]